MKKGKSMMKARKKMRPDRPGRRTYNQKMYDGCEEHPGLGGPA